MPSGDINAAAETIRRYIACAALFDEGEASAALDELVAEVEQLQHRLDVQLSLREETVKWSEQLRAERDAALDAVTSSQLNADQWAQRVIDTEAREQRLQERCELVTAQYEDTLRELREKHRAFQGIHRWKGRSSGRL